MTLAWYPVKLLHQQSIRRKYNEHYTKARIKAQAKKGWTLGGCWRNMDGLGYLGTLHNLGDYIMKTFVICLFAAICLFGITRNIYQAAALSDCLAKGYPEARVDWKFNSFCVSYEFRTTVKN